MLNELQYLKLSTSLGPFFIFIQKRTDMIDAMFDKCKEIAEKDKEKTEEMGGHYNDFFESFITMMK